MVAVVYLTLYRGVDVVGEDDEIGYIMAFDDPYFVISGLGAKQEEFWEKAEGAGFKCRPSKQEDSRIRVDFGGECGDERWARKRINEIVRSICPSAKIRQRVLGCGLREEVEEYSTDDLMTLEGAFSDEERQYLPVEQRAAILGIKPSY